MPKSKQLSNSLVNRYFVEKYRNKNSYKNQCSKIKPKKKQPKYAVTKKSLTSYAEMLKLY